MKFERRHLIIRTMEMKDVEDYYYQYSTISKAERIKRIEQMREELPSIENDISSKMILVAEEKDTGRLIGAIYGKRVGDVEAIHVSIPNDSKVLKYSYEIVDQFIKICKENWPDIKLVRLHRSKEAEKYFRELGIDSEYISLA